MLSTWLAISMDNHCSRFDEDRGWCLCRMIK
jgi:hypothetical protein